MTSSTLHQVQLVKTYPVSWYMNASYYLALGLNPEQVKSKRNVTSFL